MTPRHRRRWLVVAAWAASVVLAGCGGGVGPPEQGAGGGAASGGETAETDGAGDVDDAPPPLDWSNLPPSVAYALSGPNAPAGPQEAREREEDGEEAEDTDDVSADESDGDVQDGASDDEGDETDAEGNGDADEDDGADEDDEADDDGNRYDLKVTRRFPEGASFAIRYSSVVDGHVEMDVPGMGQRKQRRQEEVRLRATARVEDSSDAGRPEEIEIEIERFDKDTGEGSETLLDRGTVVEARWNGAGEVSFESREMLEDHVEKALRRALPDRETEDISWVPDRPVAVGAEWALEESDVRAMFERKGMSIESGGGASVDGRLAGVDELHGKPALRLVFEGEVRGVTSDELPPDAEMQESRYDFRAVTFIPVDADVPIMQHGEVHMDGTMKLKMSTHGQDMLMNTDFQQTETTEYVLEE